jgi:hypothetical protein
MINKIFKRIKWVNNLILDKQHILFLMIKLVNNKEIVYNCKIRKLKHKNKIIVFKNQYNNFIRQ